MRPDIPGNVEMPAPNIFVSYSARPDPAAGDAAKGRKGPDYEIARCVVEALQGENFNVWWDADGIEVDDLWYDKISQALAECHGAVILLSDISIESEFVQHEAGFLSVRKRSERDSFVFCSLLLRSLGPDKISNHPRFRAIQFDAQQLASLDAPGTLGKVLERLQPLKAAAARQLSAAALLEGRLVRQVFGSIEAPALYSAAQALGWAQQSNWSKPRGQAQLFVRHLLSAGAPDQYSALTKLKDWPNVHPPKLFEKVAPFWVDGQAAEMFAAVVEKAPGHCGALINSSLAEFTPKMFLRRAWADRQPEGGVTQPAASNGSDAGEPDSLAGSHTPTGRDSGSGLRLSALLSVLQRLGVPQPETEEALQQAIESQKLKLALLRKTSPVVLAIDDVCEDDLYDLADILEDLAEVVIVGLTGSEAIEPPNDLKQRFTSIQPLLVSGSEARHNETQAKLQYELVQDVIKISAGIGP